MKPVITSSMLDLNSTKKTTMQGPYTNLTNRI